MARVLIVLASMCSALAGCSPLPVTVAARPLTPIARGEVRRIAVLPFTTVDLAVGRTDELGAEPLSEPPGDTVTRAVATAMRDQGDWLIVDDLTVGEAFRRLYGEVRAPTASEAVAVGTLLRADAVLRGEVKVFEERIGTEFAANRPAHVVFAAELLRPADGVALWQAEYAEQQQALSENLWNLPGFVRAGGTWVRAGELAQIGAAQIAARLHDALYGPAPRRRGAARTKR
ncbi:MAG: hypothetical protein IT293_12445 [Deltaproteobacteria bacterium]|nr:hypothetical protein [Deltaproteobacteria bacterium]